MDVLPVHVAELVQGRAKRISDGSSRSMHTGAERRRTSGVIAELRLLHLISAHRNLIARRKAWCCGDSSARGVVFAAIVDLAEAARGSLSRASRKRLARR